MGEAMGEHVSACEILVEVATDVFDTEIPSSGAGVLTEILVPVGATVDIGVGLAMLSVVDSSDGATGVATGSSAESEDVADEILAPAGSEMQKTERPAVQSPVVRKLAGDTSIDLAAVPGTGAGGRITRANVDAFIDGGSELPTLASVASTSAVSAPPTNVPQPAAVSQSGDVERISRLRSGIAGNLIHAKRTAAHAWTSVEVDFERVAVVRAKFGAAFKETEGFSLTYLPFIARATTDALACYPAVNSLFDIDAGTQTFHRSVDLGISVDLNEEGLVIATVPDADAMTLEDLARSIRQVATDARDRKLGPDDLSGFTFTITNPGPYGSFMTAPIIPVPNAAILSTDTVAKKPVALVFPDGSDGIAIHHIGYLGLSWDHRVFDGSTAVLFLRHIKEALENWNWDQELS